MPKIGAKKSNTQHKMLTINTPLEDHRKEYGLWVKREDLSCPQPGPPFSKTRGVYAHVKSRPERVIGVLDTYHSQAGHAVARACQVLGKECINYYPEFKNEPGHRPPQDRAAALGATLHGLKAGRSAILFHQARKLTTERGGYMMPNALKLQESVDETAKEVQRTVKASRLPFDKLGAVIIPISSGTIAAGVIKGLQDFPNIQYFLHMGYSRSREEVERYVTEKSGVKLRQKMILVDEGYAYKAQARPGESPPWPCNPYYDLKAFRWWRAMQDTRLMAQFKHVLFWNIG